MARIKLTPVNAPSSDGPGYGTEIDTGVMGIEIREAFLGVTLVAPSGNTMSISMRDDGFESTYTKADEQ